MALRLQLTSLLGKDSKFDEACDGEQALEKSLSSLRRRCGCRPYMLIFMDINMPNMDGYTATKLIRRKLKSDQTKIVAVTAYPESEVEDRAKEVGMDAVLNKPIDPTVINPLLEPLRKKTELSD